MTPCIVYTGSLPKHPFQTQATSVHFVQLDRQSRGKRNKVFDSASVETRCWCNAVGEIRRRFPDSDYMQQLRLSLGLHITSLIDSHFIIESCFFSIVQNENCDNIKILISRMFFSLKYKLRKRLADLTYRLRRSAAFPSPLPPKNHIAMLVLLTK